MNRYFISEDSLREVLAERYNATVRYDISKILPDIRWLICPNEKILQQLVDARIVFENEDVIMTEYHYLWANIPEFQENTP